MFKSDESIRGELQNYIKSKQATVEGLFGRYEYLLTIGMQEFASLYPFLCERKLGREKSDRNKDKLEIILRKSIARNINERILIGLGSDLVTDASILSDELIADKAWNLIATSYINLIKFVRITRQKSPVVELRNNTLCILISSSNGLMWKGMDM